jgi:dihydroorotate dehydrogenase subfamily 2
VRKLILFLSAVFYKYFLRNIIFLFDSEKVHGFFVDLGEKIGKSNVFKNLLKLLLVENNDLIKQKIAGINFSNPIGLAAGFDYNAKLTQVFPYIGFGFETIGTITNNPYKGNPKPRLGRLIKSKSLMVYKGFKNEGIKNICLKLLKLKFENPVGLSIGKTNSQNDVMTQKDAVEDIISAFKIAEKAKLTISYYELNISCPNLFGNVTFYTPENLKDLLNKISKLNLTKPVFIKMPISKTDNEILSMLKVIVEFPIAGVIIGNTQNNRSEKSFVKEELNKYPVGNFSGKPTEKRSNELIKLAYENYGKKLVIIGCGGVFNSKDAYRKIKLGASLIQLITGLIFEGPQLAASINYELPKLLKKDGYKNISEAVGSST